MGAAHGRAADALRQLDPDTPIRAAFDTIVSDDITPEVFRAAVTDLLWRGELRLSSPRRLSPTSVADGWLEEARRRCDATRQAPRELQDDMVRMVGGPILAEHHTPEEEAFAQLASPDTVRSLLTVVAAAATVHDQLEDGGVGARTAGKLGRALELARQQLEAAGS